MKKGKKVAREGRNEGGDLAIHPYLFNVPHPALSVDVLLEDIKNLFLGIRDDDDGATVEAKVLGVAILGDLVKNSAYSKEMIELVMHLEVVGGERAN